MPKYNVETFNGSYTILIMDPPNSLHPSPSFTKISQKVELTLYFHNGVIDGGSNASLLQMISIIEHDLKKFSELIAAHWFDEHGAVEYLNKAFHNKSQDDGRVIDSKTYQIASMDQLEEFLSILKSIAATNELHKAPSAYTPLLASKTHSFLVPEEQFDQIEETGVVARLRRLFSCC